MKDSREDSHEEKKPIDDNNKKKRQMTSSICEKLKEKGERKHEVSNQRHGERGRETRLKVHRRATKIIILTVIKI